MGEAPPALQMGMWAQVMAAEKEVGVAAMKRREKVELGEVQVSLRWEAWRVAPGRMSAEEKAERRRRRRAQRGRNGRFICFSPSSSGGELGTLRGIF